MAVRTPIYLILGHGTEEIIDFDKRPILPPGYTLVTVSECGIVSTKDEVCPIVDAFADSTKEEILSHPQENKKEIQELMGNKGIHVYRSGNKYPKLNIHFYLDWHDDTQTTIMKSGLYKFPINSLLFKISEGDTVCKRAFKTLKPYQGTLESFLPIDYAVREQFEGSLIPTVSEAEGVFSLTKKVSSYQKNLTYNLESIFERGGPGVYFFVICRSPRSVKSPLNLVTQNILSKNRYATFLDKNWSSKVKNILPLLEEDLTKHNGWIKGEINNAIKNYKQLEKIPTLRKMSVNQQTNRKRKNRRTRRNLK